MTKLGCVACSYITQAVCYRNWVRDAACICQSMSAQTLSTIWTCGMFSDRRRLLCGDKQAAPPHMRTAGLH